MFLDLDRFRRSTAPSAHVTGDRLQGVAQRLRQKRARDRHGQPAGRDEFLIVLTGIDVPDDAAQVAAKILDLLDPAIRRGQAAAAPRSPSASPSTPGWRERRELMKNADTAMYHARKRRNTYRFFDERR